MDDLERLNSKNQWNPSIISVIVVRDRAALIVVTLTSCTGERYSLRSVGPESLTTSEYLSPVLPNQPDSGDRGHGQKTHLDCHQFDYTCRIVVTSFAAPVDVTGAVCA